MYGAGTELVRSGYGADTEVSIIKYPPPPPSMNSKIILNLFDFRVELRFFYPSVRPRGVLVLEVEKLGVQAPQNVEFE